MGSIFNFVKTVITFIIVIYVGSFLVLAALGGYLTPSDKLEKSDVIIVFSGGQDRTDWGIELYKNGWAPRILFSGAARDPDSPSNAQVMRQRALDAGLAEESIFVEERAINTYQNALYSKEILDSVGVQRVILVTSPYHQRRAFETLQKVYAGEGLAIINSPSGYSDWNAKSWWERPASADVGWSEILRLIWAKLTGEYS